MAAVPQLEPSAPAESSVAEPGPAPLFGDNFEGEKRPEGWLWINDPGDQRRVEMGHLVMPVLPESSISGDRALPKLRAPALVWKVPPELQRFAFEATLRFEPKQNFQGAGLIILSERQAPMLSLTRAFCDQPAPCQKDAIYFDNWLLWARAGDEYQSQVRGGNDLPPGGTVRLRIQIQPGLVAGFVNLKDRWHPVGEWQLVIADRVGFVGLVTTTGGQPVEKTPAEFDDFVVLPFPESEG
jgi:hypothetical protein